MYLPPVRTSLSDPRYSKQTPTLLAAAEVSGLISSTRRKCLLAVSYASVPCEGTEEVGLIKRDETNHKVN